MAELYCILHEENTYVDETYEKKMRQWNNGHCEFPLGYAFCEPPISLFGEFDNKTMREWAVWCKAYEPAPEEIEVSDLQAQELIHDCEEEFYG